ncbi:MAG: hypothetical protein ACT4QC_07060 [Planctomycetaceae bacterium]
MYRIQPETGERWTIVDLADQVVFAGSLRQCEDWLDQQENLVAKPAGLLAWYQKMWRKLKGVRSPASRLSPANQTQAVPPQLGR